MICVKENNLKRQFSKTKTKQMKTFKMFSQRFVSIFQSITNLIAYLLAILS